MVSALREISLCSSVLRPHSSKAPSTSSVDRMREYTSSAQTSTGLVYGRASVQKAKPEPSVGSCIICCWCCSCSIDWMYSCTYCLKASSTDVRNAT